MRALTKSTFFVSLIGLTTAAYANDSTGYVSAGGIEYIKNKNIQMYSEDLYLSPEKIKVAYEFRNLSNQDITETILFPLPVLPRLIDGDFANTDRILNSFKVWSNGQSIKTKQHVQAFVDQMTMMNTLLNLSALILLKHYKAVVSMMKRLLSGGLMSIQRLRISQMN